MVWRCTNRLDNGSHFCHNLHIISESVLYKTLNKFIAGLAGTKEELEQILELNSKRMEQVLKVDIIDETAIAQISEEYEKLQKELEQLDEHQESMEQENVYLKGIREYIQNTNFDTMKYDDRLIKEVIETIIVKPSDKLYIRVKGGYETEVTLLEE